MTTMIQVENATKSFTLSYHRSLKQLALAKARGRKTHDVFNAVDDVSFSVQEGEAIGLMGLNGPGKSTLLSLLAGIDAPTAGRARVAGWGSPAFSRICTASSAACLRGARRRSRSTRHAARSAAPRAPHPARPAGWGRPAGG